MKTYEIISHELALFLCFTTESEARAYYTQLHQQHPKANISFYETVKFFVDEVQP